MSPASSDGQNPAPWSNSSYVGAGCAMFKFVGVERGQPFTAERTDIATANSADQGRKTIEWIELVGKDRSVIPRKDQILFRSP